jgi:hypothetical protein
MPTDLLAILVLVGTSAVTFVVARLLSRRWRRRRRDQDDAKRQAGESRQVRRARERRGRK